MKKTPLFLLLLLTAVCTTTIHATSDPKLKITWGQEYELPYGGKDIDFFGNIKDGFTQVSIDPKKSLSLQKFSPSLKLESTKTMDLTALPKDLNLEKILKIGGKLFLMYNTWEKAEKKERLWIQELNEKKGSFEGSAKQMIETEKLIGMGMTWGWNGSFFGNYESNSKFNVYLSTDSTKLGVIGNYINDSKDDSKNKQKYGFWMFDKNLNTLWKKEVVMPYTEKRMDIYSKTIDREGNILFVARVFEDESEREIKDGKPNFHFEILKYTKDSKGAIVIPFKFEENYVSQLSLFEDFQGRIVCTGFYASKNRKGKVEADGSAVDGTFFLKINPEDNKISNINKGFYEIPTEVLMQYEKGKDQKRIEKEEAKGGVAAAHLELRSVKFDEDGGITLFGEQYYETTIYSGKITYTLFHFNDIIVQHIGSSDADSWTRKIPKNQVQGNWKGLGFNVLKTTSGYSVFFMDNLKNLNLTTTQAPEPHSTGIDGILMCVSLSNKGDMKKTKVFDTREMKDNINIIKADQVGANTFIDRTWVKKKSKICLMTIE